MNTFRRSLLIVCLLATPATGCGTQLPSSDVSGVWEGILHAFGLDVRLIYKVSVNQDGTLSASHDSPDYALNNIPGRKQSSRQIT